MCVHAQRRSVAPLNIIASQPVEHGAIPHGWPGATGEHSGQHSRLAVNGALCCSALDSRRGRQTYIYWLRSERHGVAGIPAIAAIIFRVNHTYADYVCAHAAVLLQLFALFLCVGAAAGTRAQAQAERERLRQH